MPEVKQDIGLSILTSSAVFGAWSAWNSSLFTAATFVDNEEKYQHAKMAMDLGFATAAATGIGVYYVYGKKGKVAAVAAVATGAVLYAAYYYKLKANPKLDSVFNRKSKKLSTKKLSNSEWIPLSDNEIQNIRNLTKEQPIQIVSNP